MSEAQAATPERRSGFVDNPDYRVDFEPCPKRVRAVAGGVTLIDSTRARLMLETGHTPVYYVPPEDVAREHLTRSGHTTFCPYKGDASYWTLEASGRRVENAVWSYEAPFPEVAQIAGYMALYWDAADHWYEEDQEVFVHPTDPHVRIDVRESRRPVRVVLGGETLAETTRARVLFETGLPVRYYIPAEDVRTDLLRPSETRTACPYKGTARYWSATVGGRRFEDVAWSYPDPLPEALPVRDLLCFYQERIDALELDGEPQPRPQTKWS